MIKPNGSLFPLYSLFLELAQEPCPRLLSCQPCLLLLVWAPRRMNPQQISNQWLRAFSFCDQNSGYASLCLAFTAVMPDFQHPPDHPKIIILVIILITGGTFSALILKPGCSVTQAFSWQLALYKFILWPVTFFHRCFHCSKGKILEIYFGFTFNIVKVYHLDVQSSSFCVSWMCTILAELHKLIMCLHW